MACSINISENEDVSDGFNQKYSLTDIFKHIIDGQSLEIDIHNIKFIMKHNLKLETDNLKTKLKCVSPYMFIHFIRAWPGWQKSNKYFENKISFESWFEKFKEYLIFKVAFFIKNYEQNSLIDDDDHHISTEVQTFSIPTGTKETAPFTLEIRGPPKLLNSLVFCEGVTGNALLKEYKLNSLWPDALSIRQLINWPCIELEFKSPELGFKRSNEHEYKRFLTFSTEKLVYSKPDKMVEEIEIIDAQVTRQAYTLNAIKEYCNLYMTLLKHHQNLLSLTNRYLEQIEIFLEDFILDIVDINFKSMATNSTVLFNIGNSVYARNKSIKTSEEALCLMDSLIPKMRLSLVDFSAITNPENINEPFPKLQKLFNTEDKPSIKKFLPTIVFKCTFCNESFNNNLDIWFHLKLFHNMEQPVLCFKCKQSFKITDLADNRWRHNCVLISNAKEKP